MATIAAGAALLAAIISVSLVLRLRQQQRWDLTYLPPAWDVVEPVTLASVTPVTTTASVPAPPSEPPPLPIEDVSLVFTAGGDTYAVIDQLDMPPYHQAHMVADSGETAIAEVAPRDVPDDLRTLQRNGMIVDGACRARVTGFAVVARLYGAPREADADFDDWTTERVMTYGRPVLAARIEGCIGTVARDAKHPPIVGFDVSDSSLADKASQRFLESDLVASAQYDWEKAEQDGRWYEDPGATFNFRTFVDPRNGATWVLVHAYRYQDCGQIGGNVIGLYRIDGDELTTVVERTAGEPSYDQLIDVDDDGEPELVGSSTSSQWIERASGDAQLSLEVQQLGCGC